MIIVFYITAGVTALAFLGAGAMKVLRPKTALHDAGLKWVDKFSPTVVKLIGMAEILGALGLILPTALNVAPILSPVAGLCLAALMTGAIVVHLRRSESPAPPLALAVLAIASAVLGFVLA